MSGAFGPEELTRMLQEKLGDLATIADDPASVAEPLAEPGDYAALFGSPLGQKVLTHLVSMTIIARTYDHNAPKRAGYNREGQSQLVQYIIDMINAPANRGE